MTHIHAMNERTRIEKEHRGDFKFQVGDDVNKVKGYTFIGKVLSSYKTDNGNRYDVQIDTRESQNYVHELFDKGILDNHQRNWMLFYVMNCHGMIHIFAEEQLCLRTKLATKKIRV